MVIRAAALSLGLAWSGASALSAVAQPLDEVDAGQTVSDNVIDVAGWVIATADNRGLPFAVVDKDAAQVLVFDAQGKLQGLAPALLGSAVGDESAPGVGDRELKDIPRKDRTTPAGRFLAGYGPAAGGQTVLWVDYATAISIHPLPKTSPKKEKRKERLASAKVEDNRITHGCINVSAAFYNKVIKATFSKAGGVFYVLPDSTSIQTAFPGFEAPARLASSSDRNTIASVALLASWTPAD
jgi:hypothetical protein